MTPFSLSPFLAFALFACCPSGRTATLEFDYPVHELTNGVCLFIKPILGTSFTKEAQAHVVITFPALEEKLFFNIGAKWSEVPSAVSKSAIISPIAPISPIPKRGKAFNHEPARKRSGRAQAHA